MVPNNYTLGVSITNSQGAGNLPPPLGRRVATTTTTTATKCSRRRELTLKFHLTQLRNLKEISMLKEML